ncbi:MAG: hypothetical protein IPL71_22455 [Anaerolineales bacterium]|uniref:hypothetical protein n=1 Tax=Candidatus Villigracilis proximus TaxID=3140683 RepID=UPI0031365570|nr:hypothetical protein [Anaerolineales bacterium]
MMEAPESGGDNNNIRRFVAFLGIFFILLSQFLIFSNQVDTTGVFPPYTWLAVFGVFVLALSQLIRPAGFLQKISTWFIFQERSFWVLAAFYFPFWLPEQQQILCCLRGLITFPWLPSGCWVQGLIRMHFLMFLSQQMSCLHG